MRWSILILVLAASACRTSLAPSHTELIDGRICCDVHHCPLTTQTVYGPPPGACIYPLPPARRAVELKLRRELPNALEDCRSIRRGEIFSKPMKATFCPQCTSEFERRFY